MDVPAAQEGEQHFLHGEKAGSRGKLEVKWIEAAEEPV